MCFNDIERNQRVNNFITSNREIMSSNEPEDECEDKNGYKEKMGFGKFHTMFFVREYIYFASI